MVYCLMLRQTRRTTRTTRTVALSNENATTAARSTRTAVLRAKPASKEVNTAGSSSRVTAATAASRAKASAPPSKSAPVMEGKEGKDSAAATKRKREALGEVTGANGKAKAPVVANSKGKATATAPTSKADKKPESVVLKAKVTASTTIIGASSSSTTTAATRPPVRVFGAATTRRSTRSTVTEDAKFVVAQDEPLDDVPEVPEEEEVIVRKSDGMEVDLPAAARRASTRNGVAAPATSKPRSSRSVRRVASKVEEEDDLEDHREHKKRRTSSEAGELDRQQVEEELNDTEEAELTRQREELVLGVVEADPDGDEWDDLDAEDIDDPQMVSEYVVEIFDYLKIVEVGNFLFWRLVVTDADPLANHHAEPKLHGEPKGTCMENARHSDRLADPSAFPFPPLARDPLPRCQHHRSLLVVSGCLACKAPARRCRLHVHRSKGRGDRCPVGSQLSLLCRLVLHGGRDPPGGEVHPQDA
jgi:hypothetical protein